MENFVKSFEEACKKLGISTEVPDVSLWPENLRKHLIATFQLSKILEVNNGEWKANLADTRQWKYYPWFDVTPDKSKPCGFGLSCGGCGGAYDGTFTGARLACKSAELARFMGETFVELYEDLLA